MWQELMKVAQDDADKESLEQALGSLHILKQEIERKLNSYNLKRKPL